MRHPSPRPDGRGHLSSATGDPSAPPAARWLLVGNSRWHWAEIGEQGVSIWHRDVRGAQGDRPPSAEPWAWAAVGALPPLWRPDPARRLHTGDVPLAGLPPWLGVDRALAGWMAWRQRHEAVLVADAGTVLSLTAVDRGGHFCGGRLMAGLSLQLRAMADGTEALRAPTPEALPTLLASPWPETTAAAMVVGVSQGLAAALASALRQLRLQEPSCSLVLTGGDAQLLLPLTQALLGDGEPPVVLEPDLALRALVALRPAGPGEWAQPSPRSVSS